MAPLPCPVASSVWANPLSVGSNTKGSLTESIPQLQTVVDWEYTKLNVFVCKGNKSSCHIAKVLENVITPDDQLLDTTKKNRKNPRQAISKFVNF